MKKIIVSLMVFVSVSANAAGFHGGGPGRRGRAPVVIHKVEPRYHGGEWIGPALILGTAAAIIAHNRSQPEKVVIVHEPVRTSRIIQEKITGDKAWTLGSAEFRWQKACEEWKDDLADKYSRIDASCGVMTCVKSTKSYCYSRGEAEVISRF